jgi:triacylglycerol lipase
VRVVSLQRMGRTRSRLLVGAAGAMAVTATLVLSAVTGTPAGAAGTPYPVPYTFLSSAVIGGAIDVTGDAPGENDWSCKPSAAHPNPVVLVHGTAGNKATNWQTYAPLLANNGYCVFALTYGTLASTPPLSLFGGLGPIEDSAAQLKVFVDKVLAATGAAKVDIVGHSQGTFMPEYYAKFLGGAPKIDKYISLASLWHGTNVGGLSAQAYFAAAFGFYPSDLIAPAAKEMAAGSPFVQNLRAGGLVLPGIHYTNIVSRYDELVVPYTSGIEPGMANIVLQNQCALDLTEHFEIAADPIASVDVLNALDPAHPRPVPCRLVLPFEGTL